MSCFFPARSDRRNKRGRCKIMVSSVQPRPQVSAVYQKWYQTERPRKVKLAFPEDDASSSRVKIFGGVGQSKPRLSSQWQARQETLLPTNPTFLILPTQAYILLTFLITPQTGRKSRELLSPVYLCLARFREDYKLGLHPEDCLLDFLDPIARTVVVAVQPLEDLPMCVASLCRFALRLDEWAEHMLGLVVLGMWGFWDGGFPWINVGPASVQRSYTPQCGRPERMLFSDFLLKRDDVFLGWRITCLLDSFVFLFWGAFFPG